MTTEDIPTLVSANEELSQNVKAFVASGSDEDRAATIASARAVMEAASRPEDVVMNYAMTMSEIGVIFQFQEWKVFDMIPETDSISYAEIAKALDAEGEVISMCNPEPMPGKIQRLTLQPRTHVWRPYIHRSPHLRRPRSRQPLFSLSHIQDRQSPRLRKGKTTKEILGRFKGIPAKRCVVQDLPHVIAEAEAAQDVRLKGVSLQGHSFFEEQPVTGAMVYMLSRILHDYWDDNCVKILSHLAKAMSREPQARIIIIDQILLDPPTPRNANVDLLMFNIGGKERSKEMFERIAERAGLRVVKILQGKNADSGAVEMALA